MTILEDPQARGSSPTSMDASSRAVGGPAGAGIIPMTAAPLGSTPGRTRRRGNQPMVSRTTTPCRWGNPQARGSAYCSHIGSKPVSGEPAGAGIIRL